MTFLSNVAADLRFAFRMLRQNPGFSAVAILSLALGIGASSAMYSIVYALWVDPYPYRDSDRIVNFSFDSKEGRGGTVSYSLADYLELRRSTKTLEDVAARDNRPMIVTSGLPESIRGVLFTPNAFVHFGVPAMLGRTWTDADFPQPAAPPHIAVISYLFWSRHFNSDPGVIGKTIEVERQPYTILGVVPPRFTWNDGDVYLPLAVPPDPRHFVPLMAHVKKGVSFQTASAEVQAMTERFARRNPQGYPKLGFRMRLESLNDFLLARFSGTLKVLMAAVAMLLLIGCANVSILLLARATARQKEIAVRLSVGAGTSRLLQQLLTESVVLSVSGGLLGVLLAYRGVAAMVALMPEYSVPHEAVIHVNGPVVLFTFLISVCTGLLFGMAPAMQLAKTDVNEAMQDATRGSSTGVRGAKTRSLLIVAEVALTIVLLVGASVAIRSFAKMMTQPLGYEPASVLSMGINFPQGSYTTWETRNAFFERLIASLRTTPGVRSAAFTETAMPPYIGFRTDYEIPGQAKSEDQKVRIGLISSQYFETTGIPLLRGRLLTDGEIAGNAHLAVINQVFADRFSSSGRDPIGARIHVPGLKIEDQDVLMPPKGDQWIEVIGVVGSARNRGVQEAPDPAMYIPYNMVSVPGAVFLLRTTVEPHSIVRAARERVRAVDPALPVTQIRTLDEALSQFEHAYPRFSTTLFSIFAAVGLLLAASGLYSVVSYTVAQRTPEFGIRIALGAQRRHVLEIVLGSVTALMGVGAVIGLVSSWALSSLIARYIEGWNPRDLWAYAAVVAVLGFVALLACWIPARRATHISPMAALRHE